MSGMVITLIGRWQKHPNWKQQHGFFWGAVLLFCAAVIDREPLIISFESVILLGTGLAFIPLPARWKSVITITSGLLALLTLFILQIPIDWQILLGMLGLVLGATGFAMMNDKLQLTSAVIMTIYNAVNMMAGVPSALPFTILNAVFAILAIRALFAKLQRSNKPSNTTNDPNQQTT